MAKNVASVKNKKIATDVAVHIFLVIVAIVWLIPFIWLVAHSFRAESTGLFTKTFFPTQFTIQNYVKLFTETDSMNFPRMFMNTFVIACCSCVISTFFVLAVSYSLSRVKWKLRKSYMDMGMVINLFPGFMSMVAMYFLLKAMGLTEGNMLPLALIICYSCGAGTGFHIMKGYMDTIPKALDEAAMIDGCTRWQVFYKITLPLCKPMIVYQVITSFISAAAFVWCLMLKIEYGACIILLLCAFWLGRNKPNFRTLFGCSGAVLCSGFSTFFLASPMALLAVHFYNGEQGEENEFVRFWAYPAILALVAVGIRFLF